jgi:hypothetical protein
MEEERRGEVPSWCRGPRPLMVSDPRRASTARVCQEVPPSAVLQQLHAIKKSHKDLVAQAFHSQKPSDIEQGSLVGSSVNDQVSRKTKRKDCSQGSHVHEISNDDGSRSLQCSEVSVAIAGEDESVARLRPFYDSAAPATAAAGGRSVFLPAHAAPVTCCFAASGYKSPARSRASARLRQIFSAPTCS